MEIVSIYKVKTKQNYVGRVRTSHPLSIGDIEKVIIGRENNISYVVIDEIKEIIGEID